MTATRMTAPLTFTLVAAPRTKKNSGVIIQGTYPRILPSPAFSAWNRIVQLQLVKIRKEAWCDLPLTEDVNVKALFYREKNIGDAVGFYQALADALEQGGIVKNDRQVVSWDGSRLLKDAARPRVEVEITEFTA